MNLKIQLILVMFLAGVISGICIQDCQAAQNTRSGGFGQITVACPIAAPPYSYQDEDGQVKGSFIELWRLCSEKTGIKINFMPAQMKNGIDSVCAGKADAFAIHIPVENETSCLADITPLGHEHGYVFWHKNISGIKTVQDLKGFKIGVVRGTTHEAYIRKNFPNAVLEVFSGSQAMIEAARKKEIPVFLGYLHNTLSSLKKYQLETEFQFDPQNPLYTITGYAAVKKGNNALAKAVKNGMSLITADERAAIERKWLGMSSFKTEDTLIISAPIRFMPFIYLNAEGNPAGMFADIWRLWEQKTGRNIEFLHADTWKTGIENIRNGKADIHVGLIYAPEDYEGICFSQHFYEVGVSIFFPLKYGKVSKIAELSGF